MMLLNIVIRVFLASPTIHDKNAMLILYIIVYCIMCFAIYFYDQNCDVKTWFTKVYIVKRDVTEKRDRCMVKVSMASRAIREHDVKLYHYSTVLLHILAKNQLPSSISRGADTVCTISQKNTFEVQILWSNPYISEIWIEISWERIKIF